MINTLNEIKERFDKIKDHKPKATKKLNELAEILSSAYKFDIEIADEMWQYLVELNVSNQLTNAKFYIAQVFNKLTNLLEPEEATELLAYTPDRVQLMILYGYDGNTMWHCLNTLITGFIKLGSIENCIATIEFYFKKFDRLHPGRSVSFSTVYNSIHYANSLYKAEPQYKDEVIDFMQQLLEISDDHINSYVRISMVTLGYKDNYDLEELLCLACEYKYSTEFMELLWKNRNSISDEEITERWLFYLEELDEDHPKIPLPDFQQESEKLRIESRLDGSQYIGSKMQFFVSLIKDNDEILHYYFNSVNSLSDGIVYSWITGGDWDRFIRYIAQLIVNTYEEQYEYSRIHRMLDEYLDAYFDDEYRDSTDEYGRSYKIIDDQNLSDLEVALSSISAITIGSPLHDEFHESIKEFMLKASGNLDALNNVGFNERIDERSAYQHLKEYIHDFLSTGQVMHDHSNGKYRRICDALREETNAIDSHTRKITIDISGLVMKAVADKLISEGTLSEEDRESFLDNADGVKVINSTEEAQVDQRLERNYSYALDDEIAQFYFMHSPYEHNRRTELLSACIKKNNIDRAIMLIDMMVSTEENDGYDDLNGWGRQNMLTMMHLINEFDYSKKDDFEIVKITDDMRQVVKQLVDRIWLSLPIKSQEELSEEIYKIAPEKNNLEEYIEQIINDVNIYCTFPKPRGKGSAYEINRMSSKIHASFERLSSNGRLDIIEKIMLKFASVRDILKPVTYDTWVSAMIRGLQNGDVVKIYKNKPEIFEKWLECDTLRSIDIYRVADEMGDFCTREEFMSFRSMVFAKKGFIEGFDSAFDATSENTETKLLFDGDTVKIELDYLEVFGFNPICDMSFHFLISSKASNLCSVRVSSCKINYLATNDIGFYTTFDDDGPSVGCYVYGEKSMKTLTVYSDFFAANNIQHIYNVELMLVMMDSKGMCIESTTPIVLEYDVYSGYYKLAL